MKKLLTLQDSTSQMWKIKMTLRCVIEIVPHGEEQYKEPIFRLDISNQGLIRDEGFGHQVC